jgi:uncharacterized protein YjbI with pentapeptide repeats
MTNEPGSSSPAPEAALTALAADCERCFGLCCVVPAFSASADFAIDKPARQPCRHLQPGFRCGIHSGLRQRGFRGCAVYDCFGAGQQVSQVTFGGRDWRQHPEAAGQMFGVFETMRQLHELLWYLTAALALPDARPVHDELRRAAAATAAMTRRQPAALRELDLTGHRSDVNALLLRASELARARAAGRGPDYRGTADHRAADHPGADYRGADHRGADHRGADHRGADLAGARLAGADLAGASLRGASLIAADLRRADLTLADLTGADLRDADLRGADLTGSLFVTQSQLDAARGDASTRLPPSLTRPAHWAPEAGRPRNTAAGPEAVTDEGRNALTAERRPADLEEQI